MENTATEKVDLYSLLDVSKTATKNEIVNVYIYGFIEKSV